MSFGEGDKNSVAYANGRGYANLKEAIAAAATAEDKTVTLLADIETTSIGFTTDTVLDLATYTLTQASSGGYVLVNGGAKLEIKAGEGGAIVSKGYGVFVSNGALTVASGTIIGNGEFDEEANKNGGTIKGAGIAVSK